MTHCFNLLILIVIRIKFNYVMLLHYILFAIESKVNICAQYKTAHFPTHIQTVSARSVSICLHVQGSFSCNHAKLCHFRRCELKFTQTVWVRVKSHDTQNRPSLYVSARCLRQTIYCSTTATPLRCPHNIPIPHVYSVLSF